MTAAEFIRNAVERDLQRWCEEPESESLHASVIPIRKTVELGTECGIRFQRCGGGRRIIRKQRGGA